MKIKGVTVYPEPTSFKGVRYVEHPFRKHGRVRKDRYFFIRYQVDGRRIEQGLGWSSDGWTEEGAALELKKYKQAARELKGPQTRHEERELKKKELKKQKEKEELEKRERITFREASGFFLDWGKAHGKEWNHDETRLRLHILPLLGEKYLKDIATADIEQLKISCMEKGQSPATVRHVLQIVRGTFNHALRMGYYEGPVPTRKVKFPKLNNKRMRFFSYEQAEKLLQALQEKGLFDIHDMTLMALETGMRFSEIARLKWEHVDLKNLVVYVVDSKSGESGEVYINQRLKSTLKVLKRSGAYGLVFPSAVGTVRKDIPDSFMNTVQELGFNEGITDPRNKLTFHSTRHTFGSWLALQGTPLLTIKELMRHKSVEMTLRYAHLIPGHKREAVERLGSRASGKVVEMEEIRKRKAG